MGDYFNNPMFVPVHLNDEIVGSVVISSDGYISALVFQNMVGAKFYDMLRDGIIDHLSLDVNIQPAQPKEKVMNDTNPILKYFTYAHLQPQHQEVSKPFCELAEKLDMILPNGPEKSTALRKLLEGKDAAVRAALDI